MSPLQFQYLYSVQEAKLGKGKAGASRRDGRSRNLEPRMSLGGSAVFTFTATHLFTLLKPQNL